MKNCCKKIGVIGVGLFLFFFGYGETILAYEQQEVVVVADISIQDGLVMQDTSGDLVLSFTLQNNGTLTQPGIRYGVKLYRVSAQDVYTSVLVDEFVFDETIVLEGGESILKEVRYQPPAGLSGVFEVRIVAKTTNGFPLGMIRLDSVRVSGSLGVSIDTARCVLGKEGEEETVPLSIGTIIVNPEDVITMTCRVSNNDTNRSVSVLHTVFSNSIYGKKVLKEQEVFTVPQGVSEVTFLLPIVSDAGEYQVRSVFLERGQEISAPVLVSYRIVGDPFFIANVLLDTHSYAEGESASVVYTLIPRNASVPLPSGDISVTATMYDASGRVCGVSDSYNITDHAFDTVFQGEIAILLEQACLDAHVRVAAYDGQGNEIDVLYSHILSEEEKVPWILWFFIIIVFLGVYRIIVRDAQMSKKVAVFLGVMCGVSTLMIGASSVQALSFSVRGGDMYGTVNLSGDTFAAGSNIEIDAWMSATFDSGSYYPAGIRWAVDENPTPTSYSSGFFDQGFATPPCTTETTGGWWGTTTRMCDSDNTSGDVPPFTHNTALSDTIVAPIYSGAHDIFIDVPVLRSSFGYSVSGLYAIPTGMPFTVTGGIAPPPVINLTASNTYITQGSSTSISWEGEHIVPGSCVASGGWSGTRADVGTESTGYLNEDTTFTLTCDGTDGSTAIENVTVFTLSQCEDGIDNDNDGFIDIWDDECDLVQPELDNDEFGGPATVDLVVSDTTEVPYGGSVDVWWSPENAEICTATSEYVDATPGPWSGDKTPEDRSACGSGWAGINGTWGDNYGTTYFRKTYPEKVAYIPGDVIELALGFEDNPGDGSAYEVKVYWGIDDNTPDNLVQSPADPSYTFSSSDGATQTAVAEIPVPDVSGDVMVYIKIESMITTTFAMGTFTIVDPSELDGCLGDHVETVSGLTQDITFSIICEGPQGLDTDTVLVDVLPPPDYSLWGGSIEIVNPAMNDAVSVGVTPLYGYTDTVTLSLDIDSRLPNGVDVYLDDTVLSSGEFGSGTVLHVDITGTVEESGSYIVTISGTDGSLVRTYDVVVQLNGFMPPEEYPENIDYSEF